MSRIRSVHPGFFTDEDLVSVSFAARLLFIGLGVEADDKGIFEWKPLTIKMRVFPGDDVDVKACLTELVDVGALRQFASDGKAFGAIRNFRKFQRPKTPNDIHPAPAEILAFVGLSPIDPEPIPPKAETFPPKGEKPPQMEDEGEGVKGNPQTPKGAGEQRGKVLIPEDWKLPAKSELPPKARACAEQWTDASYETHGEAFHGYWRSRRSKYADWTATWANRVVALHSQVIRDQKFGNAPTDVSRAKAAPGDGALFARYTAGEISFEQFDRERTARKSSSGPPRAVGDILGKLGAQIGAA